MKFAYLSFLLLIFSAPVWSEDDQCGPGVLTRFSNRFKEIEKNFVLIFAKEPKKKSDAIYKNVIFEAKPSLKGKITEAHESVPSLYAAKDYDIWKLPLDETGKSYPKGHPKDIYFTGDTPIDPQTSIPDGYLNKAKNKPELFEVSGELPKKFTKINVTKISTIDGRPTEIGQLQVSAFLRDKLGLRPEDLIREPEVLGNGASSVAFRVCPKKKSKCFVIKFKRFDKEMKIADIEEQVIFDVYYHSKANKMFAHIEYVTPEGKPMPFLIDGEPANLKKGFPKKQLIRGVELEYVELLQEGVVVQEEVVWKATEDFEKWRSLFVTNSKNDEIALYKKLRQDLIGSSDYLPSLEKELEEFIHMNKRVENTGPSLKRIANYLKRCEKLKASTTIAAVCLNFRKSFNIPDDFFARVRATEQAYRDTAPAVIRDRRANFPEKTFGATNVNGVVAESGYDYLHGVNVGWNPEDGRPVFFDQ